MDQRQEFQDRLCAAQDMGVMVRSTGQRLEISADGYAVLHHGTSQANALSIYENGLHAGTFFAASKMATHAHAWPKHRGDLEVITMHVDARDVEFSTGSGEFFAPSLLTRGENGAWCNPCRPVDVEMEASQVVPRG